MAATSGRTRTTRLNCCARTVRRGREGCCGRLLPVAAATPPRLQAQRGLQFVDAVDELPREAVAGATEVSVRGRRLVLRLAQVEIANDGRRTEVEDLLHDAVDLFGVDSLGAERLDEHR